MGRLFGKIQENSAMGLLQKRIGKNGCIILIGVSILAVAATQLLRYPKQNTDWLGLLPACPCRNPDWAGVQPDDGWAKDSGNIARYHAGSNTCFRSYPPVRTVYGESCQQCCYDASGDLITGGSGAGTPDKVSTCRGEHKNGKMKIRLLGLVGHFVKDVWPWHQAGGKNGGWKKYNLLHPPDNRKGCRNNPVSAN